MALLLIADERAYCVSRRNWAGASACERLAVVIRARLIVMKHPLQRSDDGDSPSDCSD
jgi:hypothetical protein